MDLRNYTKPMLENTVPEKTTTNIQNISHIARLRDIWKNNSNFIVKKTWHHYFICKRDYYNSAFQALLDNIDIELEQGHLLKVDTTTTVGIVKVNNQQLVIKRYNIKDFKHAFKRSVSRTRASKCWRNAHQLLAANIPTPQPIAILEKRCGPLRKQAYYIYEHVVGTTADELFKETTINNPDILEKTNQIVTVLKRLQFAKINHGDLKATNIIFNANQPYLIDLDQTKKYHVFFFLKSVYDKDILRFLKNWEECPKVYDVLKNYLIQKT